MPRVKDPLENFCFICQKYGPCYGDSPCLRLAGKDRVRAYQAGYYAQYQREFREDRLLAYWNDLKVWEEEEAAKKKEKAQRAALKAQTVAEFRQQRKKEKAKIKQARLDIAQVKREDRATERDERNRVKRIAIEESAAQRAIRRAPGYLKPSRVKTKAAAAARMIDKTGRLESDKEAD